MNRISRAICLTMVLLSGGAAVASLAPSASSCDRWLSSLYGKLPYTEYSIVDRAARTLEGNTGGGAANLWFPWHPTRAARPSSAGNFNGVWNWDCAFMALAMAKWDADLAREQVRIFMRLQKPDGMYPDCWKQGKEGVFAGCTKPPVLAWAVWACEQAEHDDRFLREAYASLARNVDWWNARRRRPGDALYHYDGESTNATERQLFAGWESGMDDSPRWDGKPWQLWPVDLNCYMLMTFRAMRQFAERLGKPDEARTWTARTQALEKAVETTLWNASAGLYADYDFVQRKFSKTLTPASFLPLYVGTASSARASQMAVQAKRLAPGWPTVSYDDPAYDPVGYWRGRTWVNVAYFALRGLKWYGFGDAAEAGRATLLAWMLREPSNFNENYNSKTGQAVGALYFGWSSAFAIKFVLDWENDRRSEMP